MGYRLVKVNSPPKMRPNMSFTPLTTASAIIQLHAFCAIAALLLGLMLLFLAKGTRGHVWSGRMWIGLMLATSLSSFFISQSPIIGPFGFIHILSVVTLLGLWRAFSAARRRDFKAHGRAMMGLYFQALILAGLFTFAPGRIMHRILFSSGDAVSMAVFMAISAIFIIALVYVFRKNLALTRM
jgi:uncharacterized membrane protein